MSRTSHEAGTPEALADGQLWKLNHFYIQIVKLGRKWIHYRMLTDIKETGARIKTSGVDVLWGYLKSRRAQLVARGRRLIDSEQRPNWFQLK
ncbi:MAG TPA: hypothetical protein VKY92_11540 [Verrucomicrobiae bacterium]|nr:hypothetical protein [Verrucomicrobiae bacterium]